MTSRFKQSGKRQMAAADRSAAASSANVMSAILKQARKSGQLNLSNRSLDEVPSCVWRINIDTPEEGKTISMENPDDRWWEQIDLTKLILASNSLTCLSNDIQMLPALTVLDLHDNHIEHLPDALNQLTNLNKLNVSQNSLKSLPDCLCQLRGLQVLYANYNSLNELPADFGMLDRLEDLNISNNKLTSLPAGFGCLTRLMKLNVANNQLKTLPHEIGSMKNLKTLEATHNQIHTLPDELGFLRNLELLYLRHNKLGLFPRLELSSSLKELHLGNNAILEITVDNLSFLSSLAVLDVRDNRLSKLPDEISVLQYLERLDVTNNSLTILPYTLGTMTNLKFIVLDGNPIKSVRRDIIQRGTTELKKYLQSRMEPEEIMEPPKQQALKETASAPSGIIGASNEIDVFTLSSTKALDYSGKRASEIPENLLEAAASAGVTLVNFSKNNLTSLPPRLPDLHKSLSELDLSINKLTPSIDPCIGRLERLVMLNISNNQLDTLPDEMSSLSFMREICLSYNRFQNLPTVLYKLKKLEIIIANDNKISSIDPDGLCSLPVLATLDLQNNNIATVPPELGKCVQLRSCRLEGNQFRQPRIAILAKGTVALLEYLRDRIPAS